MHLFHVQNIFGVNSCYTYRLFNIQRKKTTATPDSNFSKPKRASKQTNEQTLPCLNVRDYTVLRFTVHFCICMYFKSYRTILFSLSICFCLLRHFESVSFSGYQHKVVEDSKNGKFPLAAPFLMVYCLIFFSSLSSVFPCMRWWFSASAQHSCNPVPNQNRFFFSPSL